APGYFAAGSSVQLNVNGYTLVNENLKKAYQGKSKYGEQYCPQPKVKHVQPGMIELYNKAQKRHTRIAIGLFGGRYERGVKVGQEWKITALEVWLATTQDEIDYMNSFPENELCGAAPAVSVPGTGASSSLPPAASSSVAAPLDWQPHTFSNARLQVSFPVQTREEAARMSDGNMRYVYTAEHSSGNYQVIAYALPRRYTADQKQQVIESMAKGFLGRNAASVISQSEQAFGAHPGRKYDLRRGSDNLIKYQIFCTDQMLYEVVFNTTRSLYSAEYEAAFFASVKLLP
ncbi:MAG: hypothetical protein EAZ89_01005, partial [Bacteroidetes bacterium]